MPTHVDLFKHLDIFIDFVELAIYALFDRSVELLCFRNKTNFTSAQRFPPPGVLGASYERTVVRQGAKMATKCIFCMPFCQTFSYGT